jgi:tetratricopeptide (TPR) repeat protein
MKSAQKSYDEGRYENALIAFRQLLPVRLNRVQQRTVLIGFARSLRKQGDLTKSVAVYEKVLKDYPVDSDTPELYLELGRSFRAMGAYKTAINRFYSVINSTIKLPEEGAAKYRQIARTAQFEIAETLFASGEYLEASRFYSRLRLLDLAPSDRAKAHFKSAYSLFLGEDFAGSIRMLGEFVRQYPDDENVPEAHYVLAMSYRRTQRPIEAMAEARDLLRMEKSRTSKDPKRWSYWQQKTGNQIANELYDQGDKANALVIYQALADLSNENAWRLPVLYQIGLCHERMAQMEQAIASYQGILDAVAAAKGDAAKTEFADLTRMAEWRLGQIRWQHSTEMKLSLLLPAQLQTAKNKPNPAVHDTSGNPAPAPAALR